MRRLLAATTLALLLASADAWAQVYGGGATGGAGRQVMPPPQAHPAANQVAAQAGADTAGLLFLYMRQLATGGQPPTQADIDAATREYFTNGASVYTVPSSGPGAAYFQNGAAAVGYNASPAASATASASSPAPSSAPAPPPSSAPEPSSTPAPPPPPAGSAPAAPGYVGPAIPEVPGPTGPPSTSSVEEGNGATGGAAERGANLSIGVTEAQGMNQAAGANPAPAKTAPSPPLARTPPPATAAPFVQNILVPGAAPEEASRCPSEPSLFSRIGPAIGGFLLGGLAVALWTRPRMLRDQRT